MRINGHKFTSKTSVSGKTNIAEKLIRTGIGTQEALAFFALPQKPLKSAKKCRDGETCFRTTGYACIDVR